MKYEYRVTVIDGDNRQQQCRLNELGADGWEMISALGLRFYFRREIPEQIGVFTPPAPPKRLKQ